MSDETSLPLIGDITFGRVLVAELPNVLARVLPPEAYTEIIGTRKKGMTDTKPHYLRQTLIDVFGVPGHGWWYETQGDIVSENFPTTIQQTKEGSLQEVVNKNPWLSTVTVAFYYRFITPKGSVHTSMPVLGTGGIAMDRKDFSNKGALTNALGDALKVLGWQKWLWWGVLNHANAADKYEKQQKAMAALRDKGSHVPGDPLPLSSLPSEMTKVMGG